MQEHQPLIQTIQVLICQYKICFVVTFMESDMKHSSTTCIDGITKSLKFTNKFVVK